MTSEIVVSEEEGRAKAEAMGALFIAASAKTASNVDMAFLTAAQSLVETRRKQKGPKNSPVNLGQARLGPQAQASSGKSKCACAGGA